MNPNRKTILVALTSLLFAPIVALATWSITEDIYLQNGSQGSVTSNVDGGWVEASAEIETLWNGTGGLSTFIWPRGGRPEFNQEAFTNTNRMTFFYMMDESAYTCVGAQVEILDTYAIANASSN